jgi:hypothetical protein
MNLSESAPSLPLSASINPTNLETMNQSAASNSSPVRSRSMPMEAAHLAVCTAVGKYSRQLIF